MYNGYRVFPGGKKRPGRDSDPSPPSSAVGRERVELYLYSLYGPYGLYRASVPVQGFTSSFFFFGTEGREDTQLRTFRVYVITVYSVTTLMVYGLWFMVYLICEMRSRVTIKREK